LDDCVPEDRIDLSLHGVIILSLDRIVKREHRPFGNEKSKTNKYRTLIHKYAKGGLYTLDAFLIKFNQLSYNHSMILNIYKPKSWTSTDVVRRVKSTLNLKKVGHAGTLDPLAEGVLIILTDQDTKKQMEFMSMQKEYVFETALGVTSETYDLEGPFNFSTSDTVFEKQDIERVFGKYVGKIRQKVPAHSAVKHKGKPLYKYARRNELSEYMIPEKEVQIYSIEILDFDASKEIPIMGKKLNLPVIKGRVICGKGTYIRSLVNDIGNDLGTGAVLISLVRTRIGDYTVEQSKNVDDLSLLSLNLIQ